MSNLSELLPTGGGQNAVDFVASGTLPNGKPVILKADGTVEAIAETATAESIPAGSAVVFNAADTEQLSAISFDPNTANIFIVAYRDGGNSNYGTAIIGTVSGTSLTFGTESVFYAGSVGSLLAIEFDPNTAGKFVIVYRDNADHGQAIVGTMSGTSLSFGTAVTLNSASNTWFSISFDPNTAGKCAIAFQDVSSSDRGTVLIGTVSGTSISFGSPVVFHSSTTQYINVSYDPLNANKLVVTYRGTSDYGRARVGTVSGTTPSFGTEVVFESNGTTWVGTAIDKTTGKILTAYYADNNTRAIVGTISGTSISFATSVIWISNVSYKLRVAADPLNTGNFIISYIDGGISNSNYAMTIVCTVSGTTPSFGSPITIVNSNSYSNDISSEFDPTTSGKFVTVYSDVGNLSYGTAAVGQTAVSVTNLTSTNFIGITAEAISSAATGSVNVYGGINEVQTGLTIGSDYYAQADGTITTTSTSPAVKVGQAISATTINMVDWT